MKYFAMLNHESGLIVFFVILILSTSIWVLFAKNEKWLISAPSILTTMGITCTFAGMTVALFGFSDINSDSGLTTLFSGMKLAFIPSTIAIILALIFKFLSIKRQNHGPQDLFFHLEINNRYLHSLLNHHIPGFSLPQENKLLVAKNQQPINKFKKLEFDYDLLLKPDVYLISGRKGGYCIVLRSDDNDSQYSIVLQRFAKAQGKNIYYYAAKLEQNKILENDMFAKFLYKYTVVNDELPISLPKLRALNTISKNESDIYYRQLISELKDFRQS